jgi:hypothetical protein
MLSIQEARQCEFETEARSSQLKGCLESAQCETLYIKNLLLTENSVMFLLGILDLELDCQNMCLQCDAMNEFESEMKLGC